MVPDKFNMVDMEGIDILFRYGDIIPGLYQKLVESIAQCRYQCLYNWYFDGVLIPPTYVEMTVIDNKVWIEDGVSVDEEDTLGFLAPGLKSVTGAIAHITDALAREAYQIACYINPSQGGTGDPSPENIRPISGWTGLTGVRTGKNLLPNKVYQASATRVILGSESEAYNILLPPGTYTLSVKSEKLVGLYVRSSTDTANTTIVTSNVGSPGVRSGSFTLTETSLCKFWTYFGDGVSVSDINQAQLNIGTVASEYETYQGDTISVSWATEAGTVYGGEIDLITRKLIVTDAEIASYNGETLPNTWISDRDVYVAGTTPTIGAQVVYKLAKPLIYNLTTIQVFTLFQGENNIWHNANGDTSVTYWYNKF